MITPMNALTISLLVSLCEKTHTYVATTDIAERLIILEYDTNPLNLFLWRERRLLLSD